MRSVTMGGRNTHTHRRARAPASEVCPLVVAPGRKLNVCANPVMLPSGVGDKKVQQVRPC